MTIWTVQKVLKLIAHVFHLSLGFEDLLKMELTYENLKQDGQATMPLREQFRGDKFGMLTYKFGIKWMFNCQK